MFNFTNQYKQQNPTSETFYKTDMSSYIAEAENTYMLEIMIYMRNVTLDEFVKEQEQAMIIPNAHKT